MSTDIPIDARPGGDGTSRAKGRRGPARKRVAVVAISATAMASVFGLGPVVAPLVLSSASAATTNCSASISGATALSRTGWTASSNTNSATADQPSNAIDGNIDTRFSSDAVQAAGQTLEVNLGSAQTFNTLDMDSTVWPGDYAVGYNVNVSTNGTSWTTVASCAGTASPEMVSFGTVTDQYLEVVLTAASTGSWWSIGELNLYNVAGGTTTTAAPTTTTTAAPTTTTTKAPTANCSAAVSGTELSQSGWTASTNTDASGGDVASNAIDGNLTTRFSSDEFQAAGQDLVINLGSAKAFDELEMAVPNSNGDYARGYSVEVSSNGTSWTTVATCTGTGTPEVVSFGTVTDQYVEVVLTAASTTSWWSVDELDLYSAGGGTTTTTAAPTTTTTAAPTTTTTAPSGANCSAAVSGTELSQSGWTASTNTDASGGDVASNAIDGNLTTRFSSDEFQAAGQDLVINLGSAKAFDELDLQVPNSNGDYARGYSVEVSSNGTSWSTVATCTGTGTPEVVSFGTVTDQYVEVVLTAASTTSWWSVDELDLYSAGGGTTTTTAAPTTTTTAAPTTTTTAAPTTTTTTAPAANCSAAVSGTELSQSGWTASTNTDASGGDVASNAIDGNLTTRFSSDEFQAAGQDLVINLGSAKAFDELDLAVPNSNGDYARGYSVEVSSNGTSWTTVATCTGTGTPEVVSFGTVTDQYVEVVLTAASTTSWWSVDELDLYSAGGGTTTTTAAPTTTTTAAPTTTTTAAPTTTTTSGSTTTTVPVTTGGSLGPNVYVFTPSTPESTIQADANTLYNDQAGNQFGTARYAMLFEPGTYGSSADPLLINMGYYEEVAGLGLNPSGVVINGVINSYNQCSGTTCNATDNFWRSIYNLTVNVNSGGASGCYNDGDDFWASSQASPVRRVQFNGTVTLMDFCESPSYASGGFNADDVFSGAGVTNGSQQQYFTQTSNIDSWSNAVWNQVFCGDNGAPATNFGTSGGYYTTLSSCGTTEEEPYLYTDSSGNMDVFSPSPETNQVGPSWVNGNTPGTSLPLSSFYVVNSSSTIGQVNSALAAGDNLLFTPGVYSYSQPIDVTKADTKIIGLGFATIIPTAGNVTMNVADVAGVNVSGIIFDAGPVNSPALLQVGTAGSTANYSSDPVTLDDIFFRIGGAEAGEATDSLIDNSNYSIIDDMWAWRADHGNGVGWTDNVGDAGLIVNGNDVSAYGLAVEHYEQTEVQWNGQGGKVVFFQNENPYDPPSQAAWMDGSQDGYPAFQVANNVTTFNGYGMGSYSYFSQGINIYNAMAFEAPDTSGVKFQDLLTVFLNGNGGINTVINGEGAAVNSSNGGPSTVVSYP